MVVALSMSHYGLAVYHLMTHACFKAFAHLSWWFNHSLCLHAVQHYTSGPAPASLVTLPDRWATSVQCSGGYVLLPTLLPRTASTRPCGLAC